MANINEILARAAALRNETALNSIDPERAGGIMYDTLLALNELWLQQGAALVISKIYASVAAMNADTSPVSDLTGKPIRPGMVVVIASSDSDNGSVYRYNGTSSPSWSLVGKIGNITPEDSLTSDSTQLPLAAHQGKVLDGKISQLGQVDESYGLKIGYPDTTPGSSIGGDWATDTTRATTKLINALYINVNVKVKGNYRIKGIFKYDSNYRLISYTSLTNQTEYTLSKGYYYCVTFCYSDQSSNVDLDELIHCVFIGKAITLQEAFDKAIKLVGIGTISAGTSGITAAGQYYYNTGANTVYLCTVFNTSPSDSVFEEVGIVEGAIFTFNNHLYVFNGTTLVADANNIIVSMDRSKYVYSNENFYGYVLGAITIDEQVTKIRDFILNQDYGLRQGFWLGDNSFATDPTRVSTKLIDALNYPLRVYISPSDYIIRGYMRFASDYTYIDYTSSGFNNKDLELPAGYIYEIVFAKSDVSLNITPAEVAPYVMINDRKDIYTLKSEVDSIKDSNSIDNIFPLDIYAQENLWYLGTSVGDTISSTTADGTISIKIPVVQNEQYELKAKGGSAGRGWYLLDSSNKIVDLSGQNFNDTIQITIPSGVFYLIAQSNGGSTYLSLKKLGAVSILGNEVEKLQNKVQENTVDSFKGNTAFLWNKLARLKTLNEGFCNIGFIGDSWTQGTEDIIGGVNQGDFQGYVKPLSKMLQDEYGYGGLGWLDFARDGGNGKMFGCANMWENISYIFTGTVTGLDGHNDQEAPYCLGICCAHTIFSNNATLSFTFGAGMLDKFKIRYYKDAHFSVSINGGAAVEITANSSDGWQETEIGTTGTDITSVLITSLADNTIIFGMDCFYGTKGVRCHKIGNRSIEASDYLKMSAAQWETGIAKLELSWASVLLAINDLGGSTSEGTMDAIVSNIGSLIGRLKVATDDGNGLVTCDINLLGVENIENSGWTGLGRLAEKQKTFAANNGYGWTNTDKCIGSNKAEFTYNGTFSDQIHLNKIGSYAYAKHIYDALFKF